MSPNVPPSLKLKVITPQKLLVDEEVQEVSLPSLKGYLGILPGHRHLLIAIGEGEISYRFSQKEEKFSIQGGYAEILSESVLVFTELRKEEANRSDERRG